MLHRYRVRSEEKATVARTWTVTSERELTDVEISDIMTGAATDTQVNVSCTDTEIGNGSGRRVRRIERAM